MPPRRARQQAATIILGAYTTPREAYAQLIPIFRQQWREQTGQDVIFEESYLGSGAQSRAIVEGFEADVTALSLEADVTRIQQAGLITHDWQDNPTNGMVSDSIVAFAVRKGNPKGINDWADLARPGMQILTPNPKTSGGAMWNVLALYGAALRGYVEGRAGQRRAAAAWSSSRPCSRTSLSWTRRRARASPTSRRAWATWPSPTRTRCWWRRCRARTTTWSSPARRS
jgi:sulfate/thiosulfate-binding protein